MCSLCVREIWWAAAPVFLNILGLIPLWNVETRFFICREKTDPEAYSNFLLVESCAWFVSTKPSFLSITWLILQIRHFNVGVTGFSQSSLLCHTLSWATYCCQYPLNEKVFIIHFTILPTAHQPLPPPQQDSGPAVFSFPGRCSYMATMKTLLFFFPDRYSMNPCKFISSDS